MSVPGSDDPAAAVLSTARDAAAAWRATVDAERAARDVRDDAIRAAMATPGMTASQLAAVTGFSRERIYQIRDQRR